MTDLTALAKNLAHRQADWARTENRPIDDKLARALLESA